MTLLLKQEVRISIYDMRGQSPKEFNPGHAAAQALSWSPSESFRSPGSYILKITVDSKSYSRQFLIR